MKKISEKYLWRVIIGIIFTLLVIHFFMNFNLIQNPKLVQESWANVINAYILIVTIIIGYFTLIWFLFWSMKDTAKDAERFLLKNLTTACFLVVSLLFYFLLIGKLDKEFTLTAIGAIIVFWYGYKTYERDKELQIIESYAMKYTQHKKEGNIDGLTDLWYEEYYLYSKGYISETLWSDWKKYMKEDIEHYIFEDIYRGIKELGLKEDEFYEQTLDYISSMNGYFIHRLRFHYNLEFRKYIHSLLEDLYKQSIKYEGKLEDLLKYSNELESSTRQSDVKISKKYRDTYIQMIRSIKVFDFIKSTLKNDINISPDNI